jgi:hypothetical protein
MFVSHTCQYSATLNDGKLTSRTDTFSGEQVTYQYDTIQRLTIAWAASWSQAYTCNGFGNLKKKVGTAAAAGGMDDRMLILNAGADVSMPIAEYLLR